MSERYVAEESPSNPEELPEFLTRELRRIEQGHRSADFQQWTPLHAEPKKPRDGMVVFADGTDWNPGSGGGLYERVGGAWSKL